MPGMTGMELSEKIKPHLPNVKIIFITSHIEYAIDAFELSIFRYVPKSDLSNRLVSTVIDATKLIELEVGREYIIQAAGRMEKIPYKDIFYIQRDGGKNSMICSCLGISSRVPSSFFIMISLETELSTTPDFFTTTQTPESTAAFVSIPDRKSVV